MARCAAPGGRPMALKRFVNGADGELLLPEARARDRGPTGSRRSSCRFPPAGRRTRSSCATRRSWPGSSTSAASTSTRIRCAPRTSTTPTSCASTSIPCPASPWDAGPRGGAGGAARSLEAVGPGRLAQDVGLARHPHQRAHRAALDLRRGAPRGAGAGARGGAARARRSPPASGGRRSATASSSTTTRTPRTARSRPPTRCGRRPTRGSRCRCAGTRCPTSRRRTSRWPRCRRSTPSDGDAHAGIDEAVGSLEALLELSARARGRGAGRRAVAAELPQAGGRAAARPAVEAAPRRRGLRHARGGGRAREVARRDGARFARGCEERGAERAAAGPRPPAGGASPIPVIEIARAAKKDEALAGLERWKARHPDAAAAPRAGRRAGRLDARPLHDLDAHPRQPEHVPEADAARRRSRSSPTTTRGPSGPVPTVRGRPPWPTRKQSN